MKRFLAMFMAMMLFPWGFCVIASAAKADTAVQDVTIEKNFNRDWLFAYGELPGSESVDLDDSDWCPVAIPHSFSIPYDLEDDSFYIGTGWYRKEFDVPAAWNKKFITLEFDGVFQRTDIYVNGVKVPRTKVYGYENFTDLSEPTHEGGYNYFSIDITDYVKPGQTNLLAVKVDNIWQADLTPRGGDHQFSAGIYRDVVLKVANKAHIDWYGTFVWTPAICNPAFQKSENRPDELYPDDFERNGTGIINTLDDPNVEGEYVTEEVMLENLKNKTSDVEIRTEITNTDSKSVTLYTTHEVLDAEGNTVATFKSGKERFAAGERKILIARSEMIKNIKLWDFDNPNLYKAKTTLYTQNGKVIDEDEVTFGFRSVQYKVEGFFLNGVKTLLDGANVHQDHGGWADAVTDEAFYRDVKYVKEVGFNFIRGSHYPKDPAFIKACDELGIGLWSEGGLWTIGGANDNDTVTLTPEDWKRTAYPVDEASRAKLEESCFDLVRSMVRVGRNNPSVLAWSMGNEPFFINDEVLDEVKSLVNELRNYAHSIDFTRKAGLGGTQRKGLNTLAVCDVAGGNGDGATSRYTNFYLPHFASEYSSGKNLRPGVEDFQYGEVKDPNDSTKYIIPEKLITLNDGTEVLSSSAGLSIWCMYHHGSIGSMNLRAMGIMDYYRLPTTKFFLYREDRAGIPMPPKSKKGKATDMVLRASTGTMYEGEPGEDGHIITNDGKSDIHMIVTMVDETGTWVNDSPDVLIKVIEGNGIFPTGKEYVFTSGGTMVDGKGAIEFRSYYSGETKIQAFADGGRLKSNVITVTTKNVLGIEEGVEPKNFMTPKKPDGKSELEEAETYGKIDLATGAKVEATAESWQATFEKSSYLYMAKLDTTAKNFDLFYKTNDSKWIKAESFENYAGEEIELNGVYANGLKVVFKEKAEIKSFNAYGTASYYEPKNVFLTDLEPVKEITQGWIGKEAGIDKSIQGNMLTVGGNVYTKGLGLHADSEAVYKLDGKYSNFTSMVAIDDEVGTYSGNDGAIFKVYGKFDAGKETEREVLLAEEKVTNIGDKKYVNVSVAGVDEIRLVTDKNGGNTKDHTNWIMPTAWGVMRDISCSDKVIRASISDGYVNIKAMGTIGATAELISNDNTVSESYYFNNGAAIIAIKKDTKEIIVKDIVGDIVARMPVNHSDTAIEFLPQKVEEEKEEPKHAAFMDCFEPMPIVEELKDGVWGSELVGARDQGNGLEDRTGQNFSYWDGGIIKDDETGKYYMFASKWDQKHGHGGWKQSVGVYATSDNLYGPYVEQPGLLWPEDRNGAGHNVFPFKLREGDPNGKYAIINSDNGRPGDIFVADSLDGPWKYCTSITPNLEGSGFATINVAVILRHDGRYQAMGRYGDIAIADELTGPWVVKVDSLWEYVPGLPYRDTDGGNRLEDPTMWYSDGLYHCVVNHWNLRKAFYMTSEDGITNWKLHSGSAYEPDADFLRYTDGTVNNWNKIERPFAYVEDGRLKAFTLAVIDSPKEKDKGNDTHGSKVIVVPFNAEKLNEVDKESFNYFERKGIAPVADVNVQSWKEEHIRNYGGNQILRSQCNNTNIEFGVFGEGIGGGTGDDSKISYVKYNVSDYDLSKVNKATISLIFKKRSAGKMASDKVRIALAETSWTEGAGGDVHKRDAEGSEMSWATRAKVIYDANNIEGSVCESEYFNTDFEYQVIEVDVTKLVKNATVTNGEIAVAVSNATQGNTLAFLSKDFGTKYSAILNLEVVSDTSVIEFGESNSTDLGATE